jgi:hypothetical protein
MLEAAHAEESADAQVPGGQPTDLVITGLFALAILALGTVTVGVCSTPIVLHSTYWFEFSISVQSCNPPPPPSIQDSGACNVGALSVYCVLLGQKDRTGGPEEV